MEIDLLVVGGGPAGLSAAITAAELDHSVIIVDENPRLGGQLIKQTHKFFGSESNYCGIRGINIAEILEDKVNKLGITKYLESTVIGIYEDGVAIASEEDLRVVHPKKIIIATGARENMLSFVNNDLPGVYGAGAVQTLVNVYGVLPGKRALMVGSGNIGLIVSYQLMQAGVEVVAILEALDHVGGYEVHAAKVRRLGIPILLRHTIKAAIGNDKVEAAVITKLDEHWQPIPGSERELKVDFICLAVGLSPSYELAAQAGAKIVYIPELGGWLPWHKPNLETSVPGLYVAGDAAGVEEAVSALLEGKIAAADASNSIKENKYAQKLIETTQKELQEFRAGKFGKKIVKGKRKLYASLHI